MTERTDRDVLNSIEDDIRAIKTAFIKDEDGHPDYSSHKQFHRRERESREDNREKRNKIFSDVGSWAIIGIITLLISKIIVISPAVLASMGK